MLHLQVTRKEGRVAEEKGARLGTELLALSLSTLLTLSLLPNSSHRSVALPQIN